MSNHRKIFVPGLANAVPLLFACLLVTFCDAKGGETLLRLKESSTWASRRVGDRELRLWRSDSASYKTLEISGNRDQATFRFNGKGGAIGRISSIDHSRTVDDAVLMKGSMRGVDGRVGKYLWGVYGWVLDKREWEDANVRHEIYVIHSINRTETDPPIGTLVVGGTVYKMHRYQFPNGGYRFKAVAQRPPSGPGRSPAFTVDLTPFLNFWKQNGLGDSRYLHEISWAVELLTSEEHAGNLTLRWH